MVWRKRHDNEINCFQDISMVVVHVMRVGLLVKRLETKGLVDFRSSGLPDLASD